MLEMRRAILIHRFMEAYKATVHVKERPVESERKGEPAVLSTGLPSAR